MREFFGLSKVLNNQFGFLRSAEGAWSWQHILQVSIFMILMVAIFVLYVSLFYYIYLRFIKKKKNS